jgi:DNA-binding HxlR family transcriptional regulator
MKKKFRCTCPITSALDILGDKWTLVIIKQMLIEHKKTFTDFIESEEAIATNILSSRLKILEEFGLLTKTKSLPNKKKNIYTLTEKGIDLAAVILELSIWSESNVTELNPILEKHPATDFAIKHKEKAIAHIKKSYKEITLS